MSKKINSNRYITSLDGLRAFAVLIVLAYHFSFSWAGGGFLGVDIFFVISGYLITDKVLSIQKNNKGFKLKDFLISRIRRLFPAAFVMIVTTFIWVILFKPNLLKNIIGDGIASIFYVSNWWFIFHKLSYFDSFGSPSPFKNLWSLSLEVQFYIVWPIILIIGYKLFKKRDKLDKSVFGLALISAMLMGILYKPGMDPSRIYYGTDTRAFELLIGSWLAIICPMKIFIDRGSFSKKKSNRQKNMLNIIATVSLTIFILCVVFVNEYNIFLYRGGLFLISLNAAILIVCVCNPTSYLRHIFSWKPLTWIGERSYGIYLWHYPIIVLSTPVYEIGNPSYLRVGLQLIITLIVADFSYNYIEMPIRKYGVKEFIKNMKLASITNRKKSYLVRRASVAIIILIIMIMTININNVLVVKGKTEISEITETEVVLSNKEEISDTYDLEVNSSPENNFYEEILAIGDSIMLDITSALNDKYDNITIDGKVGRQMREANDLVNTYAEFNNPNKAVIIELGANGHFTDKEIDNLLDSFSAANVYLVNVRVPRAWERDVNKTLKRKAEERDNVTLIDWYSTAIEHPEFFTEDGVHLESEGIEALVSIIDTALNKTK
ncbi:acetyltransferase [Clostridium sp. Sa3CUN1]|uniref:Acetyltransferase n=1 Tax=Clostridium gallinarum TaxID=2762246 RepID=A0ABR8Q061_9CLOT|nr:acyltransferase family protein [Clostridium gallinarum]MBD7913813.1 acetyltransferase [Clostridium gallinarum]